MNIGILKNENSDSHIYWQRSCEEFNVKYCIIELTNSDWIDEIRNSNCSFFLACPSGLVAHFKEMYDKRLFLICNELGIKIYPTYKEIILHEDKAFLSYWLKINNINAPRTYVFYNKEEALNKILQMPLPLVFKTSIGASGSGVKIFRNNKSIIKYINKAFSKKGILPKIGPNLKMGNIIGRIKNLLKNKGHLKKRLNVYNTLRKSPQKYFVIVQEFIPHNFEWRVVRIGSSFFAHKKIKQGDKASGTKGIDYVVPPFELLDFVKDFCLSFNFNSVAVDIFEHQGKYLINEVQTIFGHVQEYICEVNGNPGRYIFKHNNWHFEEGLFNRNLSYNLRLQNALELFKAGNL